MSSRSEVAAGILFIDDPGPDRSVVIAEATEAFQRVLSPTAVWQSAFLPPELRGRVAHGEELPRFRAGTDVTAEEAQLIEAAWAAALPPLGRGMREYLRVRVESPADVRRLRELGDVDGLMVVPSLDSRGGQRSLAWRWPLRVGVAPGPFADEWLAALQNTSHSGQVFDAELCDQTHIYDIALVSAADLPGLAPDWVDFLGQASCLIGVGDGPAEQTLTEIETRAQPAIAVAFAAPPDAWWGHLFHEMTHDAPIDVAVELVVRSSGVDALIAGPRRGLDITAAAHWFAALVADLPPELAQLLTDFEQWDWSSEGGGATNGSHAVREMRAQGMDPLVNLPGPARAAMSGPEDEPSQPRRLLARVLDGEKVVSSILPPKRGLTFAVRIALPEKGDVFDDTAFPVPDAEGATVELEVVVRGDVWQDPPAPQKISLSMQKQAQPSTWAVFPFTTPDSGGVVSVEILVLYQGKLLQAATYVSPVRAEGLPGERPTLTTFTVSGPDEPTEESRPVDATLDGCGAELKHVRGGEGTVLLNDVQAMLDTIEARVSKVLGVTGAPDSFDDERAVEVLVALARLGSELKTSLAPLQLDDAKSVNLIVNHDTRVLPLELAYDGPAPDVKRAKLCRHVQDPPPAGQPCDRASTRTVCPYAFWGLHRSIARTVRSPRQRRQPGSAAGASAFSVLYAATVIADDGAVDPKPSDSVLAAAEGAFPGATRVTSWTAWRKAVRTNRPNLLVVLGHSLIEAGETRLYIGKSSSISRVDISTAVLRSGDSPPPLVLLIACATAALGDPFGTLPGALTAHGAGAVVGTLSKIVGPQGAAATTHLLDAFHSLSGTGASVGDAVAQARRSLIAEKRPIGLILVSHGEVDTRMA